MELKTLMEEFLPFLITNIQVVFDILIVFSTNEQFQSKLHIIHVHTIVNTMGTRSADHGPESRLPKGSQWAAEGPPLSANKVEKQGLWIPEVSEI